MKKKKKVSAEAARTGPSTPVFDRIPKSSGDDQLKKRDRNKRKAALDGSPEPEPKRIQLDDAIIGKSRYDFLQFDSNRNIDTVPELFESTTVVVHKIQSVHHSLMFEPADFQDWESCRSKSKRSLNLHCTCKQLTSTTALFTIAPYHQEL